VNVDRSESQREFELNKNREKGRDSEKAENVDPPECTRGVMSKRGCAPWQGNPR
jgi:hypothetical protein